MNKKYKCAQCGQAVSPILILCENCLSASIDRRTKKEIEAAKVSRSIVESLKISNMKRGRLIDDMSDEIHEKDMIILRLYQVLRGNEKIIKEIADNWEGRYRQNQ